MEQVYAGDGIGENQKFESPCHVEHRYMVGEVKVRKAPFGLAVHEELSATNGVAIRCRHLRIHL